MFQFTAQQDSFRCGDMVLLNIKVVLDTVTEHCGKLNLNDFETGVKKKMYSTDEIIKKRKDQISTMKNFCEDYEK